MRCSFGFAVLIQDQGCPENPGDHESIVLEDPQVHCCAHPNNRPKQRNDQQIDRYRFYRLQQYAEGEDRRRARSDNKHGGAGVRMAEIDTQKRVNHHRIKNECPPDYWERLQAESKDEAPQDCTDQEKEQTLKYIEKSENPGCWIDNPELDYMVKDPHPNPEQRKDS